MKLEQYWYTHPGTRPENQDSCACFSTPESCCAILCDGLGGHGGGKAAAEIGVRALSRWPGSSLPEPETIQGWLSQANQEILATRADAGQMKTTAVALYIRKNQAIWAHIGDSRLYHFHNGALVDWTEDHSIAQLAIKLGELSSRREIPGYDGRSRLIRVLGDESLKPEIHPTVTLAPGDHAFLLCSDGLWERLQEDELLLDLHKATSPEEWVYLLRCRAIRRKSNDVDNNTAIAVWIKE